MNSAENLTEHLEQTSPVWLFSDEGDVVPLPTHMTRACQIAGNQALSHIEISGGEAGDGVHARYFVNDPRIIALVQGLGYRSVQELRASKRQIADFESEENQSTKKRWGLMSQHDGRYLVTPASPDIKLDGDDWDVPRDTSPIEYSLNLGNGTKLTLNSADVQIFRYKDYPLCDHIALKPEGCPNVIRIVGYEADMDQMQSDGFITIFGPISEHVYRSVRDSILRGMHSGSSSTEADQ